MPQPRAYPAATAPACRNAFISDESSRIVHTQLSSQATTRLPSSSISGVKRHETQVPHACYNMCKLIVKPYVSIHLERLPGAKRGFAAAPERGAVLKGGSREAGGPPPV